MRPRRRRTEPPDEALILSQAALVRREAHRLLHGPAVQDLMQQGYLGLIEAAQRYDAARGVPFAAYAIRRVRGAMIDYLRVIDMAPRSRREQERRDPTLATFVVDQLDERDAERLPAHDRPPDALYAHRELRALVRRLPPRERLIVERIYWSEEPQAPIGADLGVKQSRLSQLHHRALRRLRAWLEE